MIEFSRELYMPIANFIQHVIYHPLLWDNLSNSSIVPKELLIDETTVELGKFIMMGEQCYFQDPIPVRMYGSHRISIPKESIKDIAYGRYAFIQSLINSGLSNITLQGEYRGLDIVLVNSVRHWDKIFYVEPNKQMVDWVKEYFTQDNIIFT